MKNVKEVKKVLKKIDNILILMHSEPDPDAIGSAYSLLKFFLKRGKKSYIGVENKKYTKFYSMVIPEDEFEKYFLDYKEIDVNSYENVIAVDTASKSMLGRFSTIFDRIKNSIVIDHHHTFESFGRLNCNIPTISSTSEIVLDILGVNSLDFYSASAIYAGIIFDTGGLRFSFINHKLFEKLAIIFKKFDKIDPEYYYYKIFEDESIERKKLIAMIIESIELYSDNEISVAYYPNHFNKKLSLTEEDKRGLSRVSHSLRGVNFSIFVKEEGEDLSLSFRSRVEFDVASLALRFNGGGHKKASGAKIPKLNIEGFKNSYLPLIIQEYEKWKKGL